MYARILRQLRAWAHSRSDEGAVYLGYRVGHIKGEAAIFRAVVYNKGAAVLHMLRRLVGDEAFFRGLQRFYRTWRFSKAGSEDLRAAMEAEAGVPLARFFERWIYNECSPDARFSWQIETGGDTDDEAVVRIEQQGDVFDFPVTVDGRLPGRDPDRDAREGDRSGGRAADPAQGPAGQGRGQPRRDDGGGVAEVTAGATLTACRWRPREDRLSAREVRRQP